MQCTKKSMNQFSNPELAIIPSPSSLPLCSDKQALHRKKAAKKIISSGQLGFAVGRPPMN